MQAIWSKELLPQDWKVANITFNLICKKGSCEVTLKNFQKEYPHLFQLILKKNQIPHTLKQFTLVFVWLISLSNFL